MGPRPPYLAVFLVSSAALAYEILLTRLFSIIQWHHFAYMIISLALLGFGASGTALALGRSVWRARTGAVFTGACIVFGISSIACFLAVQNLPFNALELLWDPMQPLWLLAVYLLLLLPFMAAAASICLAFIAYPSRISRIYAADLLGAGLGAVVVIGLLFVASPEQVLLVLGALGFTAAGAAARHFGAGPGRTAALLAAAALTLALPVELKPSQFKELSLALDVLGARTVDQRSGPLGWLTTVANPEVPFRHAPGLSLAAPGRLPEQLAVFTDGDAPTVIVRAGGGSGALQYLDYLSSALPLQLLPHPAVLVLGAGGGVEVLQALRRGAARVDAVELNPQVAYLVSSKFKDFSGDPYADPRVRLHIGEARGFIASRPGRYDLIQVSLLDSFSTSAAGLHALNENYLYTVEAFEAYLDRLQPGGILAVTRWLRLPPRDGVKTFATAVAALERRGVTEPGTQLAMLRSWNTSTLLVSAAPFGADQVGAIRRFAEDRWFDLAWVPGMQDFEANRFNRWQEPWLYEAAVRLLGAGRERFFEDYKFHVRPATDDRPHFFRFLKWRTVPEILALKERGGLPLLEQGYLVLAATLVQVLAVSCLLVLLPLWLARRRKPVDGSLAWPAVAYFTAIGLAFLMLEVAFIQKFILYLSHPLYAVVVVLSGFLVFAGLGSLVAERGRKGRGPEGRIRVAAIAAGLIALTYLLLLPRIFSGSMGLADAWRAATALLLIAPLAFCMGMPFPLALESLGERQIPWAWAVNGCASVISAVLSSLLAVHLGFTAVVLLAVGLYGLAAALVPGRAPSWQS